MTTLVARYIQKKCTLGNREHRINLLGSKYNVVTSDVVVTTFVITVTGYFTDEISKFSLSNKREAMTFFDSEVFEGPNIANNAMSIIKIKSKANLITANSVSPFMTMII